MNEYLKQKGLTQQQIVVALAVMTGSTNQEISEGLDVDVKTIKWHLTNVYKKLGLKNRATLISHLMSQYYGHR